MFLISHIFSQLIKFEKKILFNYFDDSFSALFLFDLYIMSVFASIVYVVTQYVL